MLRVMGCALHSPSLSFSPHRSYGLGTDGQDIRNKYVINEWRHEILLVVRHDTEALPMVRDARIRVGSTTHSRGFKRAGR